MNTLSKTLLFVVTLLFSFTFSFAEKYPDFCEVFKKEITRGQLGEEVLQLQKALIEDGHKNVSATGFFGFQTAEAIRKIQTANGLYPLGKVGPDTVKLLKNSGVLQSQKLTRIWR